MALVAVRTAGTCSCTSQAPASRRPVRNGRQKHREDPNMPASCAPNKLEPKIQMGTLSPLPGTARSVWPGSTALKKPCSSSTSAEIVRISLKRSPECASGHRIGARCAPSPRSIRPGYKDSRVPNCSAMTKGAGLAASHHRHPLGWNVCHRRYGRRQRLWRRSRSLAS